MRRALPAVALVLAPLALLAATAGCTSGERYETEEHASRVEAPLAPASHFQLVDVPVPAVLSYDRNDSIISETPEGRSASLVYRGRSHPERVANFFRDQMPAIRWELKKSQVAGSRHLLLFARNAAGSASRAAAWARYGWSSTLTEIGGEEPGMARTKVTAKREPDIFQRTFMGLFEQLSGAGGVFTAVLVGLLLVMALLWGFSSSREKARAEAWKKLTAVLEEPDLDRRVKKLEKLVDELSDTGVQTTAKVLLAAKLHEQVTVDPVMGDGRRADQLGRCRKLYSEFLDQEPDHPMALKARADLARVIEDLGDYPAAEEAYAAAAAACQDTELSFMQGKLLWGQARCALEQKRRAEALQFLETALARASGDRDSEWLAAAKQMLNSLRTPKGESLLVDGATSDEPAPGEDKPGDRPEPEKKSAGAGGAKAP
jgi:hypothetical protein